MSGTGPPPPSASRTSAAPGGGDPRRYAYLVARLRNRQITMDEATELFGITDRTIRSLQGAVMVNASKLAASGSPRATSAAPPARPQAEGPSGAPTRIATDDLLTAGILLIGAGAGVAGAILRKSRESGQSRAEAPVSRT